MKLYVGGLSYDTTQQTLQDTFAQAGTVTSATITSAWSIVLVSLANKSRGVSPTPGLIDGSTTYSDNTWCPNFFRLATISW